MFVQIFWLHAVPLFEKGSKYIQGGDFPLLSTQTPLYGSYAIHFCISSKFSKYSRNRFNKFPQTTSSHRFFLIINTQYKYATISLTSRNMRNTIQIRYRFHNFQEHEKTALIPFADNVGHDQSARSWSVCANAQTDLGLCCPLTELWDTVEHVKGQPTSLRMTVHAQDDLNLRIARMLDEVFFHLTWLIRKVHEQDDVLPFVIHTPSCNDCKQSLSNQQYVCNGQ